MRDLERMKKFYEKRDKKSKFNYYNFYLSCKQTYLLHKIFNNIKLEDKKILDIGAGDGNFLLKLIMLGANPLNITAVEYLENRYKKLKNKIPSAIIIHGDYLKFFSKEKYDIITIMAVISSLINNSMRYEIIKKALKELNENGLLIIYDYFNDKEFFLNPDYRAVSLNKIKKIAKNYEITVHHKVYLNSKLGNFLLKIKAHSFIHVFDQLKIFNDNYHFVIIKNFKK